MANFNVSLKKLTEKVSLDVVYTPKGLEAVSYTHLTLPTT